MHYAFNLHEEYRIGCVSTRSGFLRALGFYAQHNYDF